MLVKRYEMNREGRDIGVGDIHGHFTLLHEALVAIHFNPEVDRLFSVGDLIDRGPENTKALEWLSKPWFYPVKGNHDDYICRYDNDLLGRWPTETGKWFYDTFSEEEQALWAAEFRKLPIAIEVETMHGRVGIVHAECILESWKDLRKALLQPGSRKELKAIANSCMFSRRRAEEKYTKPVKDIYAVVVGHEPVKHVTKLGNVYYIDTKGWKPADGGKFTLFDLNTLQPLE